MLTYKLLPLAEKDLENIWQHTAKKWGVEQAMAYIDALDEAFVILAENPKINRQRAEFRPSVRIHPFQKHLIVYNSDAEHLTIIRILHAHMDITPQLKQ
jgi:toxin ParE1/3/4